MFLQDSLERKNYVALRQETRELLSQAGIRSNLGWTDYDIVSAVRIKATLPPVDSWNQWGEKPYEDYRDRLIAIVQEAGVELTEPVTEVANILHGLRTLLLPKE